MKYPLLSIIVPVFNMELYVGKCLRSILSQSFTDFEVIVIDDGSSDNSCRMVEEIIEVDSRVKLFRFPNGGVSVARNRGLKEVIGTFIMFIDADDYITDGYLENIMHHVSQNNADIYIWGITKEDEKGEQAVEKPNLQGLYNQKTFLSDFIIDQYRSHCGLYGYISNKLIRRDIIETHSIRFNESIRLMEDYDFYLRYYIYCQSFYCFDEVNYHYVIYNTNTSSPKREHNYFQMIDIQKECYDLLKEKDALTTRNNNILEKTIGGFVLASFLEMREVSMDQIKTRLDGVFERNYAVDALQNLTTKKKFLKGLILNKKCYYIYFYLILWNFYLSYKTRK